MGFPHILVVALAFAVELVAADPPRLTFKDCRTAAEAMAQARVKLQAATALQRKEFGPRPTSKTRINPYLLASEEEQEDVAEYLGKELPAKYAGRGFVVSSVDTSWNPTTKTMETWEDIRFYAPNEGGEGYVVHQAIIGPDNKVTKAQYQVAKAPRTYDESYLQNRKRREEVEEDMKSWGLTSEDLQHAAEKTRTFTRGSDLKMQLAIAVISSPKVTSVIDEAQKAWHFDRRHLVGLLVTGGLADYTVDLDDPRQARFGILSDACRELRDSPLRNLVDEVVTKHQ